MSNKLIQNSIEGRELSPCPKINKEDIGNSQRRRQIDERRTEEE